jgi:hypothetical protein
MPKGSLDEAHTELSLAVQGRLRLLPAGDVTINLQPAGGPSVCISLHGPLAEHNDPRAILAGVPKLPLPVAVLK